jgi:ParB/RepB/Spo0J family partition protein
MADDVKKPEDNKTDMKNETPANETPKDNKIAEEKPKEEKPPEAQKRSSRPPKTDKADKPTKEKTGKDASGNKSPKPKVAEKSKATTTEKVEPEAPAPPPEPTTAPRTGEQEQIVYINLTELHPFKDHPFQVKQDAEMTAMVESVKDKGVTQPAIVRPREDGGYELVSGHRRHLASELSNYTNMPCIVRDLTDEQAITQMVEDNTNQRENILPSERGAALKMQLDAIKRQGERSGDDTKGQRSNAIVADRNGITVKQVQRYIKLTELVPDLAKMVDEKKIAFTPAVEIAHIKRKNQNYIAVAIEGNQSAPSLSQAQRMRELDQKGALNPDMIDGIMMEEKKEVDKVILSSKELAPFFGNDKTPREMKDTILKLLEENKAKNPPELGKDKQPKPPER